MSENPPTLSAADKLRLAAKKRLKLKAEEIVLPPSEADTLKLLHELQVHQIELEMQNEEVREATERYSDLYDFAPIAYFTLSRTATITMSNLNGAQLLGLDRSRLEGRSFRTFVHADYLPIFTTFLKLAFAAQHLQAYELELKVDGRTPLFVQIEARLSDDGKECRIAATDITRLKLAEAGLRKNEEQLRRSSERIKLLFDNLPVGVTIAEDPECRIITVNPTAARMFETTPEGNIAPAADAGKNNSYYHQGRKLTTEELPLQRAVFGNCTVENMEIEAQLPSERRWTGLVNAAPLHDSAGKVIGGIAVVRDITVRKEIEEILKNNQERLALAVDAGQIGIFDLDLQSGNVQWTRQHEAIFGYEPTTTTTTTHTYQDWAGRVHPEDLPEVEKQMRLACEERIPFQTEYRLIWPDGSVHWINVTAKYIFDENGSGIRLTGAVQEITSKKELEESLFQYSQLLESRVEARTAELREKDKLLITQNRLAAMGDMINNIAHQWRQPLNVLGLNVQRIGSFYGTDRFNREFLDTSVKDIMKLIQHMSQTIDDFRTFFRPDKEKTYFSVNQSIKQAINLVSDNFRHKNIEIILENTVDALIHGFPNEFSQVIMNILQNSHDAFLEREITGGRVTISMQHEDNRTVITITDNAGGIPEEIVDRIFEPYFSTKGLQGTGIGLYMSKNIIENNMGGGLTVRNAGGGAEFRIAF